MFSWSLSCADKICGIKIVQSFSWSHNCADFLFVESKLCRQVCSWRQSCAGKIWSHNCADNTCVLWSQTVQAFLVMSKLCRQEFAWEVKTVQAIFLRGIKSCADKTFLMELEPGRKTLFVESKLCIQQFAWSQNSADNKMWSQHCAGISFVVSKLCRPAFLWSQSCADLFFV